MNQAELKGLLKNLHRQLNILKEREAKYLDNAPLELLNQIQDHQTAIELVQARLAGQISAEAFEEQLAPLNLALNLGGQSIFGKNIIQIGALVVPTWPLLALLLLLLGGLAAWGWSHMGPAQMPAGSFNVAVAEIGVKDAGGRVQRSKDGQDLSLWIFNALQREYPELPSDANVHVWHNSLDWTQKWPTVQLGPISTAAEAAALAGQINANLVIYGALVSGQKAANFGPEFYVTKLPGEANELDEIGGVYQLGAPIPVQLPLDPTNPDVVNGLQPAVSVRAKAMRWFTIGFIQDLFGRTVKAYETFKKAEATLSDWKEGEGKELLYYFIGREALLLSRPNAPRYFKTPEEGRQIAEEYFNNILNSKANYARAYLGLGGVFFQRAQSAPSTEERLALAQQAVDNYNKALANVSQLLGEQTKLEAQFGLAVAYALKADAYLKIEAYAEATPYLVDTIQNIEAILPTLRQAGQHRSLGHADLALGAAYERLALINERQGQIAASKELYQKAQAAFNDCIAQGDAAQGGSLYDVVLQDIIQKNCQPSASRVEQKRLQLKEEP